jgi:hypothetical protein
MTWHVSSVVNCGQQVFFSGPDTTFCSGPKPKILNAPPLGWAAQHVFILLDVQGARAVNQHATHFQRFKGTANQLTLQLGP